MIDDVLGDAYIILGAALFDDNFPIFVLAAAVSYYISGGMFCLWFLLLLLFQSTNSKFPRIVILMYTKLLTMWLLVMFAMLVLSLHILSRHKSVISYDQENRLLTFGIPCTLFGIVMTSYSLWILKSYINVLEEEEASQATRIRFMSFPFDELRDRVSELPKLATQPPMHRERTIKTLRNEYRRFGSSPANVIDPASIRLSQVSILSASQVSMLSAMSTIQPQEENRAVQKELKNNNESGSLK